MRRIALSSALAAFLALGALPAHAQYESRALYDRIDRLERDLQMLQGQAARGGATIITSPAAGGAGVARGADSAPLPTGMAARLDDRVDQLEELVRQLTGRVEEANFKANQVSKQLERLQADLDLRFKDLQAGQGPAPAAGAQMSMPATGGVTPPKGADAPGPAPGPQVLGTMPEKDLKKLQPQPAAVAKTPQAAYEEAYAAAQRGDYASAEAGFQDFLAKNPKHELAGNANYWLGDIAYAKKDFGAAAGIFLEAYKKHPKHGKAPDMIYKAGSAFGQMGKKKEACTAFTILFNDHPNMPDRVKRAATAEKKRYECK